MSCSRFYKQCPKCNESIHMGFQCKCGGDPWNIEKEKQQRDADIQEQISFTDEEIENETGFTKDEQIIALQQKSVGG